MKKISILGCGWLGLPLAQKLVHHGCDVKGSTTSPEKSVALAEAGIIPFTIKLHDDQIEGDIAEFLDCKILIIDIPPGKTGKFSAKMRTLTRYIEASPVKKVLLVSSISVYGDNVGDVDELTQPKPNTENGHELLEAEKLLTENDCFSTTIVRFGGLIGGERHPVKYLSGKLNDDPAVRVNLIDRADCIGIIRKIISLKKWNETYNAVSPFHPTRKEYYTKKARDLNLPLPTFNSTETKGKIVRADKVINDLGYIFKKPFL